MNSKLEVQGLSYSYHSMDGETKALSNISFQVEEGEFLAVVGPVENLRFFPFCADFSCRRREACS